MIPLALKAVSVWILCCLLGRGEWGGIACWLCAQHVPARCCLPDMLGLRESSWHFPMYIDIFFKDLELRKVNKTPKRLPRGLKMTLTLKKIKVKLWIVNLDGSPGNQSSEWGPRDGNIGSYQFGSAWPSTLECRDQVNWINTYVNYKIKTTLI